jgi:hypothetical protein
MKLRVLISLLFVVATTFASIHELEHIDHVQDSSTCLVCTVSHNFLSADINNLDLSLELSYVKEIESKPQVFSFYFKKTDNHSNAPPSIS